MKNNNLNLFLPQDPTWLVQVESDNIYSNIVYEFYNSHMTLIKLVIDYFEARITTDLKQASNFFKDEAPIILFKEFLNYKKEFQGSIPIEFIGLGVSLFAKKFGISVPNRNMQKDAQIILLFNMGLVTTGEFFHIWENNPTNSDFIKLISLLSKLNRMIGNLQFLTNDISYTTYIDDVNKYNSDKNNFKKETQKISRELPLQKLIVEAWFNEYKSANRIKHTKDDFYTWFSEFHCREFEGKSVTRAMVRRLLDEGLNNSSKQLITNAK